MKLKYDLVVIGGTKQSILAAEYGAKLGARVALVIDSIYLNENNNLFFLQEFKENLLTLDNRINFRDFLAENKLIFTNKYLPNLELLGVDVIANNCYFDNYKKLTLLTDKDELESVSYLLAMTSSQLWKEEILEKHNNLTINDFILQNNWDNLPESIVIIGKNISTIYLANKLTLLGKKITLITENKQILPTEDDDISFQLQLILESQGVEIYTKSNINQLDIFNVNKVTNNDDNLSKNQIIIFDNNYLGKDKLKLETLGIKSQNSKILVNSKLQTQHSKIYGCGDLLGGYNLDNVAEYEVKIAVNNSLFFPWQQINYNNIPYTLATNPPIYRVGYTEKQAKLFSRKNINILTLNSHGRSPLNLTQNDTFIKIILDNNNYILGFHGLGFAIEEILTGITLLMTQKKPFNYLFKIKFCQVNSLQVIKDIQQAWLEKNQQQNQLIMNFRETFFIWKRE
jgi:pyruvate/2-oxoglutarate dehydrogenase complex dihydrolipoamide dehydrogenase (E3) component